MTYICGYHVVSMLLYTDTSLACISVHNATITLQLECAHLLDTQYAAR